MTFGTKLLLRISRMDDSLYLGLGNMRKRMNMIVKFANVFPIESKQQFLSLFARDADEK